jgi:hypothetical protein
VQTATGLSGRCGEVPSIAIDLLLKLLPWIGGAIGIFVTYLFVKNKGVKQERARWQEAQQQMAAKVKRAESKDAEIDAKVRGQVEKIKAAQGGDSNPDIFKF